ncbi:MAG TPA: hypothetical protein DGN60_06710 [Chloroflexi bacterium]|nr:hypothetical protein [Chloroflexota bacterium]
MVDSENISTGVVSSPHYLATQVGVNILTDGGNAFDAAVAISLAIGVVQPYHSGIGGGGSITFLSKDGLSGCYQGRGSAPAKLDSVRLLNDDGLPDYVAARSGPIACVVPALVQTLKMMHYDYGRLSWKKVVESVVPLASEGFLADSFLAMRSRDDDARSKIDAHKTADLFADVVREGHHILQPEMATSLGKIASDHNDIRNGSIAQSLSGLVQQMGGVLSVADLVDYQPFKQQLIEGKYRQWRILVPATPTIGALQVLFSLRILQNFKLDNYLYGSSQHLHIVAEALKLSFVARGSLDSDDDAVSLCEYEQASQMAGSIRHDSALDVDSAYEQYDNESCTSHFSVADREGNIVSQTQTIGGIFGSGIIDPISGIVINNLIGDFSLRKGDITTQGIRYGNYNLCAPGVEPASSQSPIIAINQDDGQVLAVGAAGGPKIVSAVVQALVNYIDFGLGTKASVDAPRLHCHGQRVEVESGISLVAQSQLSDIGHDVVTIERIAILQMICRSVSGWEGASDPRGPGRASILLEEDGDIVTRDFGYSNTQV